MSLNLWAAFGIGLILGSFVNVLVHRLPRMVMASFEPACDEAPRFDLCLPASHCPHCQTPLRLQHLLPVLSFVWLKGRCGFCKHPIGWQYPAVELLTALIWAVCAWHWGITSAALCWALFGTSLLALSLIDWQTTLLPDALTQPLLWLGLIASASQWVALPLTQAVWGAVWGYAALWSVATVFERITGKQGMGGGDFKLLAALGAWLGPFALIPLVILASFSGAIVGLSLQWRQRLPANGYVPFGPFLAAAGAFLAWQDPATFMQSLGWPTF
jgi:leader peptidase (prepilin peptidase)/N-methyltransferase